MHPIMSGTPTSLRRLRVALLVAGTFSTPLPAVAHVTGLDDFDGHSHVQDWVLSLGTEFPGAEGKLETRPGVAGKALGIEYDFGDGGLYVAAEARLEEPIDALALTFSLDLPENAQANVRVRDATGQWLQYPLRRSLVPDSNGWFTTTVVLQSPNDFFSGANDGLLHFPLDFVSLVINKPERGSLKGIVGLDDLSYSADLHFAVSFDESPFVQIPELDLFEGLGTALHRLNDEHALDLAREAGLTWTRTDIHWWEVEKEAGVYTFGPWDAFLDRLEERGMSALLILDYPNSLYDSDAPDTPEAVEAYQRYAREVVRRYSDRENVRFEIGNEPDTERFWRPSPDAAAYAALAKAGIEAIRSEDPDALVTTGGLSWFDFDYLEPMLKNGAADDADAVGIHLYRDGSPENIAASVPFAKKLIRDITGKDLPLWNTEWGYPSSLFGDGHSESSRKRQAVFAVRSLVCARLAGFPLSFWYNLTDSGEDATNHEHNYGLLTVDGSQKPALGAIRALYEVAKDRVINRVLNGVQPLVNGIVFEGDDDRILMLWSSLEELDLGVFVDPPEKMTDMYGVELEVATQIELPEEAGPVYLHYPLDPDQESQGGAGGHDHPHGGSTLEGGAGNSPGHGDASSNTQDHDTDTGCSCSSVGATRPRSWEVSLTLLFALLAHSRRRNVRKLPG